MSVTTNPNDSGLQEIGPDGQQVSYLVLSDEEIARGFVQPVRTSYRHVGTLGPQHPTRGLTADESKRYSAYGYVLFEEYPEGEAARGRFWTQTKLDHVGQACGKVTHMSLPIAETYARQPGFYGGTFCSGCGHHGPVGLDGEFVWVEDGETTDLRVGT